MQTLKDIITGICLALMAAGLLRMLAPENGAGKLMKVIISLFILCAVVVPFAGGVDFDFNISAGESSSGDLKGLNDVLISQREELAADKIKEQIEFVLAKFDIQHEGSISVEMRRLDGGITEVGDITVYLPEDKMGSSGDIASAVRRELGFNIIVKESD